MKELNFEDLKEGMSVQNKEGDIGVVMNCKDPHNIHVVYKGTGILIDWYKDSIECSGSALYCIQKDCKEYEPLYLQKG